jgi:hypothetical protein
LFVSKNIVIPEIERTVIDGKRHYITPEGKIYPSITTVLSVLSDSSIEEWKKRVGEEQSKKISGMAAHRGTIIHKLCEDFLKNKLDEKKIFPVHREMFNKLKPILIEKINNIYAQETPLWSDFLKVAGTVDCIAEYEGKISVIDFKTSKYLKEKQNISSYFQQASAYCVMFEERTKIPVNQIVIMIGVDDESPQIFVEKRDNYIFECMHTIKKYNKEI